MSTTALAADRIETIQQELDQARRSGPLQQIVIPPCPELLARLNVVLAQAEPDLNEVARIASSDVAMAATLLKSANSPLFASGQPVQTIGAAMNRLGLEQTAAIISGFLVQRAIKVNSSHLQRFWERARKRAVAMGYLAQKLPGLSFDVAHTYGLFCHVGLPVMMQSVKGYAGTMVEANARIDRSYVATENANHRTDHAVVGALVARVWKLSPTVTAAIRLHHDMDILRGNSIDPEVVTLMAAGLVAEYFVRRHEAIDPDVDWTHHADAIKDWLQITDDDLVTWEDELREPLDEA
ncbi:MAG TPA: HDOD domain-containing protein [Aquabacterium sp.]|nr:HDOD domain-containing protein [Aquabacterium sp.]